MYKVDVTDFREVESKSGFPKSEADEIKAHALFYRTITELYSNAALTGSFTVILYGVGKGADVPLLTQLVSLSRK